MKRLYIYQDDYLTSIFSEEMLASHRDLAKRWAGDHAVELDSKSKLHRIHRLKSKKEIAWIYRKRFGRVLRTSILVEEGRILFKRKLLGLKPVESEYFILDAEGVREYIEGTTVWDEIENVKDKDFLKNKLEIFISHVFYTFSSGNRLSERCYDVSTANTVIDKEGRLVFFDFEFLMKNGVDKSYLIYRIIRNSPLPEEYKREFYNYFCDMFLTEKKFDWCIWFHQTSEKYLTLPPYSPGDLFWERREKKTCLRLKKYLFNKIVFQFFPDKPFFKKLKPYLLKRFVYKEKYLFDTYFQS